MFISRKKFNALEKRIADLESKVQGQQKVNYETKVTQDGTIIRLVTRTSPVAIQH